MQEGKRMYRFLFTTGTGTGHVDPVLPVASTLIDRGHQVLWLTGRAEKAKVEATGARFHAYPEAIDTSLVGIYEFFPDYAEARGLEKTRIMLKQMFLDPCLAELDVMDSILLEFPADALVSDVAILAPYFKSEMGGPPSALISFVPLALPSRDTAPYGLGVVPGDSWLGRVRNRVLNFVGHRILLRDVTQHANAIRAELGLAPLDKPFLRAMFELPDLVICLTTPAFEYPRSDLPDNVHFVGPAFPKLDAGFQPPSWWQDLSGSEPVILVNQGTEATDLEDVVLPTVRGLEDEPVLVIAVPVQEGQLGDLPGNVRAEPFVPFDRLMPHVDVMVSNGGYGGTQMALAHGIPLVVAGETEDKMEVAARVEWSGTGINLRTQRPSPEQVRRAVKEVRTDPRYRENARAIQADFAKYDAPKQASELLESLAQHG